MQPVELNTAPKPSGWRTLGRVVLVLLLTAFTLVGLCGGFFAVIDLSGPKPGHTDYVGLVPYFSLGIGAGCAWGCYWLFKRLGR